MNTLNLDERLFWNIYKSSQGYDNIIIIINLRGSFDKNLNYLN